MPKQKEINKNYILYKPMLIFELVTQKMHILRDKNYHYEIQSLLN